MKRKFLRGEFLKSLTILTGGSCLAQLVLALVHIVTAKAFCAEILGIYSFLISIPSAFIGVVCGRYDLSIVYEEDEKAVFPLIKLNVLLNLFISTVAIVGNAVYIGIFKQEYLRYWWTLPLLWAYLVAYGLTNTLNAYNNRNKEYKSITKMHLFRVIAQNAPPLLVGAYLLMFCHRKTEHAILGVCILLIPYCLGMLCGIYTQGKTLFSHFREILKIPHDKIRQIAKKHIKQPLLSAPAIFANSYSYSHMSLLIENYGTTCLGYYSLSSKLLGMPISLISGNISKVFFEEASREYNQTGRFRHSFHKTFLFLFVLAVPLFFCMRYLAPPVCVLVFGNDWSVAGEYIRILAWMFTCRFVSTALSVGLYVCRKQGTELFLQCLLLAVTVAAGIIAFSCQFSVTQFLRLVGALRAGVLILDVLVVFLCAYGIGTKKQFPSH